MTVFSNWKWKAEKWREDLAAKLGGEKQAPRPRLCPSCGSLVGSTASRCYQCGTNVNFSLAAGSKLLERLLPATSPAAYAILTLSCVLYAATLLSTIHMGGLGAAAGGGIFGLGGIAGPVLYRFGESIPMPYLIQSMELWRLVMAIFLHGSLVHIGMNMWVLMDVGPVVEEVYGGARFLFIYVVTGIGGFVLSSVTGHASVGGSASLLGIIGVMLALTTTRGGAAMKMLRSQLLRWLIYIGIFGLIFHGVDNMAHLGGLAVGFAMGKMMADRLPSGPRENLKAQILGWGTGAVVVLSIALMLWTALRPG